MVAFRLHGDGAEIPLLPVAWHFFWVVVGRWSHLVFLNTMIRNDDMKLRLFSSISASSLLLIWLLALPA